MVRCELQHCSGQRHNHRHRRQAGFSDEDEKVEQRGLTAGQAGLDSVHGLGDGRPPHDPRQRVGADGRVPNVHARRGPEAGVDAAEDMQSALVVQRDVGGRLQLAFAQLPALEGLVGGVLLAAGHLGVLLVAVVRSAPLTLPILGPEGGDVERWRAVGEAHAESCADDQLERLAQVNALVARAHAQEADVDTHDQFWQALEKKLDRAAVAAGNELTVLALLDLVVPPLVRM